MKLATCATHVSRIIVCLTIVSVSDKYLSHHLVGVTFHLKKKVCFILKVTQYKVGR